MGLPAASCITPMRVTGTWLTVTVQLALTSGLLLEVAVIRQVPALTAVTLPAASTVAMLSSLEVQVTPWFRAVQGLHHGSQTGTAALPHVDGSFWRA